MRQFGAFLGCAFLPLALTFAPTGASTEDRCGALWGAAVTEELGELMRFLDQGVRADCRHRGETALIAAARTMREHRMTDAIKATKAPTTPLGHRLEALMMKRHETVTSLAGTARVDHATISRNLSGQLKAIQLPTGPCHESRILFAKRPLFPGTSKATN